MARKITIEPITRIEGHGKVTIQLDDEGKVARSRFHVVEFRGFERFVQGRPYWETPVLVQRLCGICPVSHHLAAAKAMDVIVGIGPEELTPTAEKMRRLMHYGQMLQSHALHFFHLVSPDLLFGMDADPAIRNVIGVALKHRDLAVQGVLLRKYGQEVILATAGKKIHGTGAIPGGINKNLTVAERDALLKAPAPLNADTMVEWSQGALDFFKSFHKDNAALIDGFAPFPSNHLSLVRKDGALDLYHGVLRAVDSDGRKVLDDVDYKNYLDHIGEEIRPWSYMKFPYLRALGKTAGWYRVGPLARLNTCDFIPTPLAQKEFEIYKAYTDGKPNNMSLHTHWARLDRTPPRGRGHPGPAQRQGPPGREARPEGETPVRRRRPGRGPSRDPFPSLPGRRERLDLDGQPHRLDDQQQRADEPGGQLGGDEYDLGETRDHRRHAQPGRGRHPRLRPLPQLRHPRPGADAACDRARRRGRDGHR